MGAIHILVVTAGPRTRKVQRVQAASTIVPETIGNILVDLESAVTLMTNSGYHNVKHARKRQHRSRADHTFEEGKCRWATAGIRQRSARKRSSAHPHEVEPRAHQDPTAGIPANVDGLELGADGEEQVAEADRQEREGRSAEPSSSSTDRPGRGPDREQRVRRTYREQGDNPEAPRNWSNFDIRKVVRLFRTNRESPYVYHFVSFTDDGGTPQNTLGAGS